MEHEIEQRVADVQNDKLYCPSEDDPLLQQ